MVQTRDRSNAIAEIGRHNLIQNPLWVPGMDVEMRSRARGYISSLINMYPIAIEGGRGGLGDFMPTAKLYILAHGHNRLPMFKTEAGYWNADQLADLLLRDGLSLKQRDIELLVCYAGESVNTKDVAAKMMGLQTQYTAEKAAGNESHVKQLVRKYEELEKKSHPQFFENDPESLLLPLAAQLSQALRIRRFTHFRIISYKCPVAQYNPGPHVYLDLTEKGGPYGVSADDPQYTQYRAFWH